jgi:acylphosphatase
MAQPTTVEIIAKKYSMSTDEFISLGSKLALKEKKKNFQIEKIEILARYSSETVNELQQKIKEGTVPEHPAWEDLIEIQNIEAEIKEIEGDIKTL